MNQRSLQVFCLHRRSVIETDCETSAVKPAVDFARRLLNLPERRFEIPPADVNRCRGGHISQPSVIRASFCPILVLVLVVAATSI